MSKPSHYILDSTGTPVPATFNEWAEFFGERDTHVGFTTVLPEHSAGRTDRKATEVKIAGAKGAAVYVSTVFIGTSFCIWETMVFVNQEALDRLDLPGELKSALPSVWDRYKEKISDPAKTKEDALSMHEEVVLTLGDWIEAYRINFKRGEIDREGGLIYY